MSGLRRLQRERDRRIQRQRATRGAAARELIRTVAGGDRVHERLEHHACEGIAQARLRPEGLGRSEEPAGAFDVADRRRDGEHAFQPIRDAFDVAERF